MYVVDENDKYFSICLIYSGGILQYCPSVGMTNEAIGYLYVTTHHHVHIPTVPTYS